MKALTNSRLSKAVLAATGACLLLAVTSTILASQRIRPWQIKNYAITDQRDEVFPWAGSTQPPEKWKPDLSQGLDIALPFPWPEAYINQHKQPFNPWTFVKNALALCNYLKETQDPEVHAILKALHARLLEYSTLRDGQRFLLYRFKRTYRKQYSVEAPWTSAYASGAALMGLTSISECARMPEALITAKEVLAGLARPIDPREPRPEYWVSFLDGRGYLWFEEQPLDQVEQPRILNGHVRALTGLYFYWAHTKDETALSLLEAGIKTIEDNALAYRRPGTINAYDQMQPYVADYGPARTIDQQDILFRMTGDPVFAKYRDMFEEDMRDEIQEADSDER